MVRRRRVNMNHSNGFAPQRYQPYSAPSVPPIGLNDQFVPGGVLNVSPNQGNTQMEVLTQPVLSTHEEEKPPVEAKLEAMSVVGDNNSTARALDPTAYDQPTTLEASEKYTMNQDDDLDCNSEMSVAPSKRTYASKRERINGIINRVKPKSSAAVLNEIGKTLDYNITSNGRYFQAALSIDNNVYVGSGSCKTAAQSAAADEAVKHIVMCSDMEELKRGDVSNMSYSQLLSFSLYKLLHSWDETGTLLNRMQASSVKNVNSVNPTKKFPSNPERIHPVMLLSQTHPNAVYEEVATTPPPLNSFTIQCVVNSKTFVGKGSNKKEAKKRAAILACQDLMNVKYSTPPDSTE